MKYPQDTWKWFGFAGHFICSNYCRFHMTTQVGPWLVSTVGAYVPPSRQHDNTIEYEEVGLDRLYETYVFKAGRPCVSIECDCGMPTIDGHEIDARGSNTPGEAAAHHMEYCKIYANRELSYLTSET